MDLQPTQLPEITQDLAQEIELFVRCGFDVSELEVVHERQEGEEWESWVSVRI